MRNDTFDAQWEAFERAYGYNLQETYSIQGKLAGFIASGSFEAYSDLLARDKDLFHQVRTALGRNAPFSRSYRERVRDNAPNLFVFYRDFLSLPMANKNFALWAALMLIDAASFQGASDLSKSEESEPSLTGALFGSMYGWSTGLRYELATVAARFRQDITLQRLDLQIDRREPSTGGDTALFIEWTNEYDQVEIIPLILQSKRYPVNAVQIGHQNSDGGFQFHVLRERPCPAAYLFFHNAPGKIIPRPLPPLVKPVTNIPNVAKPVSTPARKHTMTLATYIVHLLKNAPAENRHPDPRSAMDQVVSAIDPAELKNVIAISSQPAADWRMQNAWSELLRDIGELPEEDAEISHDDDPKAPQI